MVTHRAKRSVLALAVAAATLGSGFMAPSQAQAEGFIDDSTMTGGIYYWQRERDRKDVETGKYKTNLSHATECQPRLLLRLRRRLYRSGRWRIYRH